MSALSFYQVDAFTWPGRALSGNPAAVMPLAQWLPDEMMQAIAAENNLSETAFTVPLAGAPQPYGLRWFTPEVEVDLCGHATLAAAHVLIGEAEALSFETRSGRLGVARSAGLLTLDLPAARLGDAFDRAALDALAPALRARPLAAHRATGANDPLLVLLEDERAVRAANPDMAALAGLADIVIVTAAAADPARSPVTDIVSRVFAPGCGIAEDPVTGSAHCALLPFWSARLGRERLVCEQASARRGLLDATLAGDRVAMSGACTLRIEGRFFL